MADVKPPPTQQRHGEQRPEPAPEPAVTMWPANIDEEERLLNERRRGLEARRKRVTDATKAFNDAATDAETASPAKQEGAKTRLSNARLALQNEQRAYQDEVEAISSGMNAVEQLKLRYYEQYRKDHPNLTLQDEEKFRVDLEQARANTEWANTQRRVALADAERKAAQDEWDAAYRREWTPQEAAEEEKAKTAATNRVNNANAEYTDAQTAALKAAQPFAGQSAEADANIKSADAAIKSAQAGVAPRVAEAGAKEGEATASKAATEAARWDEKLGADIREALARGSLTEVQAGQIVALLPQQLEYGAAQIEGEKAKTAFQTLQTHQLEVGDIQTKIEQLQNAVQNGMDPTQADRLMEDYLSGSTPFDRQKQREAQLSGAMTQALQYGMVVTPDQQYLPGAEPGGAYAKNFAQLGVEMPSVELTDAQPLQSFVAGQGIQTTEPVAPSRFGPTGSYTAAPVGGVPATTPVAGGTQPITTVTADEFLAKARAMGHPVAQPAATAAQPAAGGGTFDPNDPQWRPFTPVRPTPQVRVRSIYDPLQWVAPYEVYSPQHPDYDPSGYSGNAAGGTTLLPRAFRGVRGTTPTVEKAPIFGVARRDVHPPMFARR
jgi:hypothetical protein